MKFSFVYITTNKQDGVLYIGVTSDLIKRIAEHKSKFYKGFTSKYNCDLLVYYETHEDINSAIQREKQMKKWNRAWKIELIENKNPGWYDLYESIL